MTNIQSDQIQAINKSLENAQVLEEREEIKAIAPQKLCGKLYTSVWGMQKS